MDPTATLARIRDLLKQIQDPNEGPATRAMLADELAELVDALDQWLSSGGFPPQDWTPDFEGAGTNGRPTTKQALRIARELCRPCDQDKRIVRVQLWYEQFDLPEGYVAVAFDANHGPRISGGIDREGEMST
jgi:hypothetical protein